MEVGFEAFKAEFLRWATDNLEGWAEQLGMPKLPLHIVPEAVLDPWEPGAVYVLPKWEHSRVPGPAVIFPEEYLRDLYTGAVERGRLGELWNLLRWKLGHEMGHHVKAMWQPLYGFRPRTFIEQGVPLVLVREASRRSEIAASVAAHHLTNKIRRDHNLDFRRVMGKGYERYMVEKTAQKRAETWK